MAVVAPAAMVAVGEPTLATLVLLELTLKTIPPAGAGAERVNVRVLVSVPESVRLGGEKEIVAVTWTLLVVEVYAGALAVMFAVPRSFPVNCGAVAGWVCPASMMTLDGEIATFGRSLDNVTVTPPCGAGAGKVTWNAVDCPSPTVTFDGRPITPPLCTVTLAVALEMLGVTGLAVIVVVPTPAPFRATVAVVAFCAMVTVGGKVTTPAGLALRLTETVDDAGAESVSIIFCVSEPTIVTAPGKTERCADLDTLARGCITRSGDGDRSRPKIDTRHLRLRRGLHLRRINEHAYGRDRHLRGIAA